MKFIHTGEAPGVCFRHRDPQGEYRWVVVGRLTYAIGDDGSLSRVSPAPPLQIKEEGFGDILETPIRYESDLAPEKPKTDIVIHANAYAPRGRAMPRFDVAVTARRADQADGTPGKALLQRRLTVTGPRKFRYQGDTARALSSALRLASLGAIEPSPWTLSEPEPTLEVPLRFDYAFGGTVDIDRADPEKSTIALAHPENPVGRGLVLNPRALMEEHGLERDDANELCKRWAALHSEVPGPQIEQPGRPITSYDDLYPLCGFGVVGKHWETRYQKAGTYDEEWERDRYPILPVDFDPNYWNAAHPDMQLDAFPEDGVIELLNLVPPSQASHQALRITLPDAKLDAHVVDWKNRRSVSRMKLDTIIVDLISKRLTMVYRHNMVDDHSVAIVGLNVVGSTYSPEEHVR